MPNSSPKSILSTAAAKLGRMIGSAVYQGEHSVTLDGFGETLFWLHHHKMDLPKMDGVVSFFWLNRPAAGCSECVKEGDLSFFAGVVHLR